VKLLESNQMHPPDHILSEDNKLLDAQPRRRKKKKEQQQQQQQVLGKQNSSFFLPSSDGLADRKQRPKKKHGLRRPQFRTQKTEETTPIPHPKHHKQCLNFRLLVQENS
jgi:hypothetical protein